MSICNWVVKIWKCRPSFYWLPLSSITTIEWMLKWGWERGVHFPLSCLVCFERESIAMREDPPAAVSCSEHHSMYQHPNAVFNLPPSPAPGKSAQSFPWHYASHPPELMRWFKWKSFQRTSYFSSPSTYLAFGLNTWGRHCKRRKHELICLLDFCIDRWLVVDVKVIQPKTVPPIIYLSGTTNYHFCLLGAELLIMTLNI